MTKFKATYYRTITEVYEVELDREDEDAVEKAIYDSYGKTLEGEKLINRYSDDVDIDNIEEIE